MTAEEVRASFDYRPKTGVLIWKVQQGRQSIGDRAGWLFSNKQTGRGVSFNKQNVVEHKIIWLWMTGVLPKEIIHKNGNVLDNRWCNLTLPQEPEHGTPARYEGHLKCRCPLCLKAHKEQTTKRSLKHSHGTVARYKGGCRCVLCKQANAKAHRVYRAKRGTEYVREINLKRSFGISIKDHDEMLKKQKGVCAICGKPESHGHYNVKQSKVVKLKNLAVDHDHTTNRVRGLLCQRCNRGIGLFGDDIQTLEKAIQYLNKHKNKKETRI